MLSLTGIDWVLMVVYFASVLAVGFALRRYTKTSKDFFLAGQAIPAWVAGLAFLSANLGAQELIGMAASGAKYGIATSHFYWAGAIPAMVFLGVFMMPFYYGSRARSVPEYLKLRFDEKTRTFNAFSFAVMTVFSSGISMYAMARLLGVLHVFDAPVRALGLGPEYIFHLSVLLSAIIVLVYILLGGLSSAIYNEVLQFFLIVAGFLPMVYLGLRDVHGWAGLKATLPPAYVHVWRGMSAPETNPMGVEVFSLGMGLAFVLSFGYWCTDFLVVQRAMAADSMSAARRTPLIGAFPKMLFPFLVILPGLIALSANIIPFKDGTTVRDFDLAIPVMLVHYFPPGMLGLGLTALMASFMSGMAGNVTAFNTVWTYDIYQSHIRPGASDEHYLFVGRLATVFGIAASILTAYFAAQFNNIMDVLQLVFAFVNAPLLATFLLGMFWKRTTGHGAFFGLLVGTAAAAAHHGLTLPAGAAPGVKGGWIAVTHTYYSEMAQNFWTAIDAWTLCFLVTIAISLATRPRPDEELRGLVYSLTPHHGDRAPQWWKRPEVLGVVVIASVTLLNIIFF
jgi:SSS family solute:Na+ symporter